MSELERMSLEAIGEFEGLKKDMKELEEELMRSHRIDPTADCRCGCCAWCGDVPPRAGECASVGYC